MKLENYIRVIAGIFVFISALLGYFVNKNWLFVTIFVGLNLFQSGFTHFCPLAMILKKLGVQE